MPNVVHIDQRKWPDNEHHQFDALLLGRDEYGTWVHAPTGTQVRRGQNDHGSFQAGFIGLVPVKSWWIVEFFPDHPEITVYVNIGTPAESTVRGFSQIDLDLDVVRRLDGTVEVIDVDEFASNRITRSYPDEMFVCARHAANRAVGFLQHEVEPFGSVADKWLAKVDQATMRRASEK